MSELLPCPFCGKLPGTKVGPPAMARCIAEGCEGRNLGAVTVAEWNTRPPSLPGREALPKPETMLAYASILEKPQYNIKNGVRYKIPTGEVIEAACAALRYCAALTPVTDVGREPDLPTLDEYRNNLVEECAVAAEQKDRIGIEWVADSLWANILKRAGNNVRKLKIPLSRTPSND